MLDDDQYFVRLGKYLSQFQILKIFFILKLLKWMNGWVVSKEVSFMLIELWCMEEYTKSQVRINISYISELIYTVKIIPYICLRFLYEICFARLKICIITNVYLSAIRWANNGWKLGSNNIHEFLHLFIGYCGYDCTSLFNQTSFPRRW